MTDVIFEEGRYGRRAVIRGRWHEGLASNLRDEHIAELELNQGKGWIGTDLSFLKDLLFLKSFEILDLNIKDVQPIHMLRELKRLNVTTYCKTRIDFSVFASLEDCTLEWRRGADSLFKCNSLKRLVLCRYSSKNFSVIADLKNLESLTILVAPFEYLTGIEKLLRLKKLRLGMLTRLESLYGIETLICLEDLDIDTCRRVVSLSPVESLKNLRRISFSNGGDIESLAPLNKLSSLEMIAFYESTKIVDGDMSPLLRQPKLTRVAYQNRRYYSHTREHIWKVLEEKHGQK